MKIKQIIEPQEKDLGDFSVRRLLPFAQQQMVGPWIFFDHMGPASFPAGKGIDVRPHPHINLATVTYLFEGEILHRDSLGSVQPICPGDINLMLAGKGITHSERERDDVRRAAHTLHGLQLWHALPETDEETNPAFYHTSADNLPRIRERGIQIRVMIGSAYGFTSPVRTFAKTLFAEADMKDGDSLTTPESEETAIYVVSGNIVISNQEIPQYSMVILENKATATIQATVDTRIAMIGGERMPKRHLEWNFVSSRKERIEQAKKDWQNGKFPKIPGDEVEFIPLPEDLTATH